MRIGLTMRVMDVASADYSDPRDAISHDWSRTLDACGAEAVLLPNAPLAAADRLHRSNLDLLVLTGGDDLRAPIGPDTPVQESEDPWARRDYAELAYLRAAREAGIPVVGVCRGFQFLNQAFGGADAPVPDVQAHRGTCHDVQFTGAALAGVWPEPTVSVNSYHDRWIRPEDIAVDLEPTAFAPDGSVEACVHRSAPIAGIMWHPERPMPTDGAARIHAGAFWQRLLDALRAHAS